VRANPEERLARIAARQQSTFTDAQALAAGFTMPAIRRFVREGRWERPHRGVLALAGSPATWERSLFAAWLAGGDGAVVSELAAGRVNGLLSLRARPEITIPNHRKVRLHGVTVHRALVLHEADVVEVQGPRVTSPTKTGIDLCSRLDLDSLVDAFDRLFTSGLSIPRYMRRRVAAYPSQGRAGTRLLGKLLERYPEGDRPPESKEERRFLQLLAQLPGSAPVPQFPLTLLSGEDIRVDVALRSTGRARAAELSLPRGHSCVRARHIASDRARRHRLDVGTDHALGRAVPTCVGAGSGRQDRSLETSCRLRAREFPNLADSRPTGGRPVAWPSA